MADERKSTDPHYGEPSKDEPLYGEGGDEKSGPSDPGEAVERGKEQARESGEAAAQKEGGEAGGMASSN